MSLLFDVGVHVDVRAPLMLSEVVALIVGGALAPVARRGRRAVYAVIRQPRQSVMSRIFANPIEWAHLPDSGH